MILWNKQNATVIIEQVGEEYKTNATVDEIKKLVKTQEVTFEVHTEDGFDKTGTFCVANDEIILSVVIGDNINKFSIDSNGVELVEQKSISGYECKETRQVLTDETVTTVSDGTVAGATLSYALFIDADEIVVTFDGTEYTCQKINVEEGNAYGGIGASEPDFSVYPFTILSTSGEGNLIFTETAGTHTVKIETMKETVETTPCFDKAVKSLANILTVRFNVTDDTSVYEGDKTAEEVKEVVESGGLVLFIIPPKGLYSARVDIVNFITSNQYITVQQTDNNTPRYAFSGNVIQANFD